MLDETLRVAIKEGLFTMPLDDLDAIRLCGTKCNSCGETALGAVEACPNCGGEDLSACALPDQGSLYTFTVVRHRPPGNYQGPSEFKPFGLGLVDLDGIIRVMAPVMLPIEELRIGMPVKFQPYVLRTNENGAEVVAFSFVSAGE